MLHCKKRLVFHTNAGDTCGSEIVATNSSEIKRARVLHTHLCRPNFFLVGAPKTGTTAMNDYLSKHPSIYMAPKELHYFSDDVLYGPPLRNRDLAWYLSQFAAAGDKPIIGETSVFYLSSLVAPERIVKFEPNAKIIINVRNPGDLIESYHSELLFLGFEEISDLMQALDVEQERRKGRNIPRFCPAPRILYYSDIISFSGQIQRFITTFGRSNVLVNVFDDFVKDPESVYRATLTFLLADQAFQLADQAFQSSFDIINPNKVIRSRLIRNVIRKPPTFARLLPKRFRTSVREWLWHVNTHFIPRIETNQAVKARIKREYAGEVERLSDLLGRDLTRWSQ